MGWPTEKLADLFRAWHSNGLPAELAFGEIEAWNFVRGAMERAAYMAVKCGVPFGVFGVIGIEYAPRAARAWWPKERLLMEDVSCAFQPIQTRAGSGHPVPQLLIDRFVFLSARYLAYIGSPWPEDRLRQAVAQFLCDYPKDIPESERRSAEPDEGVEPA
jgi:hypothetical protein